MDFDTKLRLAFVAVSVGLMLVGAILAAHGIVTPLDDPIGTGPPTPH